LSQADQAEVDEHMARLQGKIMRLEEHIRLTRRMANTDTAIATRTLLASLPPPPVNKAPEHAPHHHSTQAYYAAGGGSGSPLATHASLADAAAECLASQWPHSPASWMTEDMEDLRGSYRNTRSPAGTVLSAGMAAGEVTATHGSLRRLMRLL
jgi:hypothetical protein